MYEPEKLTLRGWQTQRSSRVRKAIIEQSLDHIIASLVGFRCSQIWPRQMALVAAWQVEDDRASGRYLGSAIGTAKPLTARLAKVGNPPMNEPALAGGRR